MQVEIAAIVIPKNRMRGLGDVQALADSMAEVGLLNPVVITKERRLVAGLHRLHAAKRLGWAKIDAKQIDASDLACQLAEIDENLIRNELTAMERGEHLAKRKAIYEAMHPETRANVAGGTAGGRGRPKASGTIPAAIKPATFTADTARKVGASRSTVEQDVKIGTGIPKDVREKLRATPVADRKVDLLKIARMPAAEQKAVVDKIAAGAKTVKDAKKEIHREAKAPTAEHTKRAAKSWRVVTGGCDAIDLPDNSVDCIITDPPYPKEFLPCYSDLSRTAARVLKPGGSCIVMVGQSYLPELLTRLGESLSFHWMCAYLTPGGQAVQLWDRKVNTFWKPLMWFVKPPFTSKEWQGDVLRSDMNDNDKRFHDWGQSESGMASIITRFSFPGETILDPFTGGGTTGLVAVKMGRNFVGYDIDQKQVELSVARLSESVGVSA